NKSVEFWFFPGTRRTAGKITRPKDQLVRNSPRCPAARRALRLTQGELQPLVRPGATGAERAARKPAAGLRGRTCRRAAGNHGEIVQANYSFLQAAQGSQEKAVLSSGGLACFGAPP